MQTSYFSRKLRYQPLPVLSEDSDRNQKNSKKNTRPSSSPTAAHPPTPPSSSKTVSWPLMAFILTSDLIGSGVLVVPKAYAKLGWIPAQLTVAILFLLTTYTGLLMVRIRKRYPHLTCYADLFELTFGTGSRWYARLCVNILLFFVVCGSVMVQADSWNAVFPHSCNLLWIGVAAVSSCLILQTRSMPNIGIVSIVSVLLITIPNIIVLVDLNRYIENGIRSPSPTALYGPSVVEAFVAILDLVFAYAGHVVFFELMMEMQKPGDFFKALVASQTVISLVYFVNGTFVYNLVGPAPWLKSPLNLSMNEGMLKTFCQVLVIAHVSLAIGVDGTVFIRAVQRAFQPEVMRKLGLTSRWQDQRTRNSKSAKESEEVENLYARDADDTGATVDEDASDEECAHRQDGGENECDCWIASPNDWSWSAMAWWFLWSAATLLVVAFLSIAISSFDDIIGLTASLIAAQTTVSWPTMFHYFEFYYPKEGIRDWRDYIGAALDFIIFFAGIYLFVAGTWANSLDIARMYEKAPKSMFSCH